jgi:O-antigen/teichoic acid export membrane protein
LAGIAVAEVIVKVAVGFVLVFGMGSGAAGGLIGALVGAFIPFISFPLYMREIGAPTFRSGELGLWRSTGRISGLQVTVGVIATIDSVLVASLSATKGGAAAYQVAATLGRIPLYISTAIGTAIFPTLHRRSPRLYAQALSTYMRIALFSTIALWAVPPALIRFIFGSELDGVHHWLRFTGVLGLLIGLFNLLMTKEQAEEQSARRVLLKCSAAVLYIAALVIGGATHGVAGLAVAGSASLLVTCVLMGRAPYQRRAARTALGILAGRSSLAALALCAIALLAVRQPAVWLIVMMLTGLGVLLASFPDLRPTRKKAKHLIATQRDQQ